MANGLLETDAMKTKEAGTVCVLTAVGPKGVAEATKVTVLADAAGTEYTAVHLNAVQGSSTKQNISWLSGLGTGGKAVVQYRVKGAEDWQTADGTSTLTGFSTSKDAAYVNTIQLAGDRPARIMNCASAMADMVRAAHLPHERGAAGHHGLRRHGRHADVR